MRDERPRGRGGAIRRRRRRERRRFARAAQSRYAEEIAKHVVRWLGPVGHVHFELVSRYVHVDVLHVPPNPARDFHTLVTVGMSARPMHPPREAAGCRYAELVLMLPPDWPVGEAMYESEACGWPFAALIELARLPHENREWMWSGHSVSDAEPNPLDASTELCAWLLVCPGSLPSGFHRLEIPGGDPIWFFGLMPLYREELELNFDVGPDALHALFAVHGVTPVLDLQRPNVAARYGRLQ
jgi:hypothetical protein